MMNTTTYILGIDTGGTYTDAAVIDATSHRILATAKAITTKGDLAVGVGAAMAAAMAKLQGQVRGSDISLVCVSTTLATNAVVEGHGNAAGVVLIGFDQAMVEKTGIAAAFPGLPIAVITGGHDHNGEERAALDKASLQKAIADMNPHVSAFAIAASFAVRNNGHELAARDMIAQLTDKPVTLSSELSNALDAPRRALTALLNARLVSRITHLITAVEAAMARLSISGDLMIVRGDGTLARAETVATRPIETVLSGPAASLVGAKWLSGLDNFIMSDMGGTTTDVGVLRDGRPLVAATGAEVGGWRTMVKAIDVRTIGLGGDSEVQLDGIGALIIGPQRAVPISLLAHLFPNVTAMLEADLAETEGGSLLGKFVARPFGWAGGEDPQGLPANEATILAQVGAEPVGLRRIAVSSGAQRSVSALRRKGLLQLCSFTPSDASVALGLQDNWPIAPARLAAKLLVRFKEMKLPDDEGVDRFCRAVWDKTVALSAKVIVETAIGAQAAQSPIVEAICNGRREMGLARISVSPRVPIVAVGGPVKVYYEELAKRLDCDVVFAEHCDVANAVGAASGVVAEKIVITVEGDGNGAFRVLGQGPAQVLGSGSAALVVAEELGRSAALAAALRKGAVEPKLTVSIEKAHLPEARDDDGLLTATITVEAMGSPTGKS
jgi:N-methylhydantoinase A/oxoprolinase/acetone carboxylase beta subunit